MPSVVGLARIGTDYRPANRALQNPALFTSDHYRQAAIAVAAGISIRLGISIPVRLSLGLMFGVLGTRHVLTCLFRSSASGCCYGSCPSFSTSTR